MNESVASIKKSPLKGWLHWRCVFPAVLIGVALITWYGFFLLHRIDITQGDLGRHLKNGQVLLQGDWNEKISLLYSNFYSSFESNFPFVNHHWGTGALWYAIWQSGGWVALVLFFMLLSLATFGIFFHLGARQGGLVNISIVAFFLIPLIAERTEIRPEAFSYLFAAIFLWLLQRVSRAQIPDRFLYVLPFIQIAWVNLHVYFILGPFLVGLFFVAALWRMKRGESWRLAGLLAAIGTAVVLACFINPAGWQGALYPFSIFDNYGMVIRENLSVGQLSRLFPDYPNFFIFKVVFLSLVGSVLVSWRRRAEISWVLVVLALGFGVWAFFAARNLTLFALFVLPAFGETLAPWRQSLRGNLRIAAGAFVILLTLSVNHSRLVEAWQNFGFSLATGPVTAAEFMRQNNIPGPLFNDFDSGGHVIWYLFPTVRPFVDNRPEAFPADFFRSTYLPMIGDEQAWREQERKFGFNAILYSFSNRASTTFPFIIHRLNDPNWAPIYVDTFNIVFLRRTPSNQEIIKRFEVDRTRFQTVAN